jgi:hypothetical protein
VSIFHAIGHLISVLFWVLSQPSFWFFVFMSLVKAVLFLAAKKMSYRDRSFSFKNMQSTERVVADDRFFGRIAGRVAEFNATITAILVFLFIETGLVSHLVFLPILLLLFAAESYSVNTWWGRMVMKEHLRTNEGWKKERVPTPAIWDLAVTWLWLFFELIVFVRVVLL